MLKQVKSVLRLSSIKGNIMLALIAMGSFSLMLTSSSYWFSNELEANNHKLNKELIPALASVKSLNNHLNNSLLLLNTYLESGKEIHQKEWRKVWQHDLQLNSNSSIAFYKMTVHEPVDEDVQKLDKLLKQTYKQQELIVQEIQQQYQLHKNSDTMATDSMVDFRAPLRTSLIAMYQESSQEAALLTSTITASISQQITDLQNEQQTYLNLIRNTGICFFGLCIIGGACMGYFLIAQIFRSLYHIKQVLKELSHGDLPAQIRQSHNETNHITKEISKLTDNLRNVQHFAMQVGNGKFDNEINVFKNEETLAPAWPACATAC